MMRDDTCSICGKRASVYEKVRHCGECHSRYNRENYIMHRRRK